MLSTSERWGPFCAAAQQHEEMLRARAEQSRTSPGTIGKSTLCLRRRWKMMQTLTAASACQPLSDAPSTDGDHHVDANGDASTTNTNGDGQPTIFAPGTGGKGTTANGEGSTTTETDSRGRSLLHGGDRYFEH